jgi:hypothetical protein
MSNQVGSGSQKTNKFDTDWIKTPFQYGTTDPYNPIANDQSPALQLLELIGIYGPPDLIDPTSEGLALWKRKTLRSRGFCFEQIIISDYSTNFIKMRLHLPLKTQRGQDQSRKLSQLAELNPAFFYDQAKNILNFDGSHYASNRASFVVAIRLLNGTITFTDAQKLIKQLLKNVNPNSREYDPELSKKLLAEICEAKKNASKNNLRNIE